MLRPLRESAKGSPKRGLPRRKNVLGVTASGEVRRPCRACVPPTCEFLADWADCPERPRFLPARPRAAMPYACPHVNNRGEGKWVATRGEAETTGEWRRVNSR